MVETFQANILIIYIVFWFVGIFASVFTKGLLKYTWWDSESRFTGLASCNWMHKYNMDCTLNMVTVTFLLQCLFNDDEEVYDPPPTMNVSTVLGVTESREDAGWCRQGKPNQTWYPLAYIEQRISIKIWIWCNQMNNPRHNPSNPGFKEDWLDCESGLGLSNPW